MRRGTRGGEAGRVGRGLELRMRLDMDRSCEAYGRDGDEGKEGKQQDQRKCDP